jgi:hypothetical protein
MSQSGPKTQYACSHKHVFAHSADSNKDAAAKTPNNTDSAVKTPSKSRAYTGPESLEVSVERSCPLLCGGFSRSSKFRRKCFEIYASGMWASVFLVVMVTNSVLIAVTPEFSGADFVEAHHGSPIAFEVVDVISVLMLIFEAVTGIIAIGFCDGPTTWLRCSDFHKLDLFMVMLTVVEGVAIFTGLNSITFRAFRLLRVFRAVTMIKTFMGIKTIIQTLKQGLSQLAIVFLLLVFFMLAFAVFGMAIFQNSFQRRCLTLPRRVPACTSDFTTGWTQTCDFHNFSQTIVLTEPAIAVPGGYPYEVFCKILTNTTPGEYDGEYPLDPFGRYHTCQLELFQRGQPVTTYCENTGVNPSNGFSHFDHLGGAMLNIFQATAVDAYYDVLHRSLQSEPTTQAITFVYYFMISCLNTFLLLGLFVAIVTGTFNRMRLKQGTAFGDVEAMAVLQKVMMRFNTKKKRAGKQPGAKQEDKPRRSFELSRPSRPSLEKARKSIDFSQFRSPHRRAVSMLPGQKHSEKAEAERQAARRLLRKDWLKHAVSLVIVGHAYAMASDQYYSATWWHTGIIIADIVCNVIFLVETMVRFTAAGSPRIFWRSRLARFELAMIVCGVAGITTGSHILRLIPALRIYRLMVYLPTLGALLKSAVSSVKAILNLVLFITIVAICFGVTARSVDCSFFKAGGGVDGICSSKLIPFLCAPFCA